MLEMIDEDTAYIKLRPKNEVTKASGPIWARFLYRRYVEGGKVSIVWRSIIDDECYPIDDSIMRINQSGW